jgi:hypothetical protein
MLKEFFLVYVVCGVTCAVSMLLKEFPILHPNADKNAETLLKRISSFLIVILLWPLLCLVVGYEFLESIQSKRQALQSKREQEKREQKAIEYWQYVFKISTESPEFNQLKLTPRCKLNLVESIEKVCSGKTTHFYYSNQISAALTELWESGTELKKHIDNSATERAKAWVNMANRGGDISFAKPDSLLHFTNTFEESIREIYDADERNTLSIQLTRLDKDLRQDPSALIQQCRISDIIPLCKLEIKSYSVFFMPDVENKTFYLLCVGLKSEML